MKVRPINEKKYGISKKRFAELYNYCLQYNEWKDELRYKTNAMKSPEITGMTKGGETGDSTAELAIRRDLLARKCRMIEETARETDPEISQYLLKAVTNEGITYNYLRQVMGIPMGKNQYYEKRRKFYWLLSIKKE